VGGLLVVLVVENSAMLMIEVPLTMFGWHAPQVPLGLILLLSGLLGALLLYMVSVFSAWRDRRALAQLRRRVMELEQAQGARGVNPASLNHSQAIGAALGFSTHDSQLYRPVEGNRHTLHSDAAAVDTLPESHPGSHPGVDRQKYRYNNQGGAHALRQWNAVDVEKP